MISPALSQDPPEEDVSTDRPKEYSFNPLQAAKEVKIGSYYFKKGSYKAAIGRFKEALKWDANDADAWLRLGETQTKLKNPKEANEAFAKYLQLRPDGKESEIVRKRLQSKS